jgi:succinyl-CoA synthetase alpha subunit
MVFRIILRKDTYYDSIVLMKTSNRVAELAGVVQAAVVMATHTNKLLLEDLGFLSPEIEEAGPNDLVIALETKNQENMDHAILDVDNLLSAREYMEDEAFFPRTLDSALRRMEAANLALISVPGTFAKREASKALRRGLNVFLFSSNVSLEEELDLKKLAKEKGLLMMGPDCGTAIINNVVLGFGNSVNQGSVGLVSAAGTGLQHVATLIDHEGLGISHAIGTGGNDLSREIGGVTMIEGLRLLEEDAATKAIVLISKPPNPEVSEKVLNAARRSKKPMIVSFIGEGFDKTGGGDYLRTTTLEDAARAVCALMKGEAYERVVFSKSTDEILATTREESSGFLDRQKHIRGLFSGGTLCYEAMTVLTPLVGNVSSNISLPSDHVLEDSHRNRTHSCIDMGTEEFTMGRLHPMIDFTLRKRRLVREAQDSTTAVLLMDIVLGYGAHHDPAAELLPSVKKARELIEREGGYLSIVASIVGTSKDHQDLQKQKQMLEEAGVVTMPSNAQAARMAALIATRGRIERKIFEGGEDHD